MRAARATGSANGGPARSHTRLTRLPMADGVHLATTVVLPHDRFHGPALLVRTAYRAELSPSTLGLELDAVLAAGFALVVQDVRGRGISGGTFGFVSQERVDGRATIAWVARQPWSDGRVATAGVSYLGRVQLMVGDAPGLVAMIPAMAGIRSAATWRPGGTVDVGTAGTWLNELARDALERMAPDERALVADLLERPDRVELVRAALAPGPVRRLAQPVLAQIEGVEPLEAVAPPPRVPSLHLCGWFDSLGEATLDAWRRARREDDAHHALIGPWTHNDLGGTLHGRRYPGGSAEEIGLAARQLAFLAFYVNGVGAPPPPVEAYVTGADADRWRSFATWPPPGPTRTLFASAATPPTLDEQPPPPGALVLASRCADAVPSLGGTSLPGEGTGLLPGPADVRALAARSDVLLLAAAPLERPLTLAGRAQLTLRVESDRPPCGLAARLAELAPDGELRVVADGVALREAPAGKATTLELTLSPAHHRFAAQHRVALLLSASERPRYLLGLDADRTLRIHVGTAAGSLLELPTEA